MRIRGSKYDSKDVMERLLKAVNCLATDEQALTKRLGMAALELKPLLVDDFPEDIRERYSNEVHAKLFRGKPYQETINELPKEEVIKLSEEIVGIAFHVAQGIGFRDE